MGFGDADEALGGVGVFRVEVWMVGFGEFVELSVWNRFKGLACQRVLGMGFLVLFC